MTDKITRLQSLKTAGDCNFALDELPAILTLVKEQHEALMKIKWEVLAQDLKELANKVVEDVAKDMWLSLDARETAEQAIAAYDAWNYQT